MALNKQDAAARAALAALQVGESEQLHRMAPIAGRQHPTPLTPKKIQVSVQFSEVGLALLRKAQGRLLERGISRAGNKGTTLEIILMEWLEKNLG
jgi:hypothetical protein